jgi:hypothetical protein
MEETGEKPKDNAVDSDMETDDEGGKGDLLDEGRRLLDVPESPPKTTAPQPLPPPPPPPPPPQPQPGTSSSTDTQRSRNNLLQNTGRKLSLSKGTAINIPALPVTAVATVSDNPANTGTAKSSMSNPGVPTAAASKQQKLNDRILSDQESSNGKSQKKRTSPSRLNITQYAKCVLTHSNIPSCRQSVGIVG